MQMKMKCRLLAVFAGSMALSSCATTAPDQVQLAKLVSDLEPGATILDQAEVAASCDAELTSHLAADFDGNGREDHAALIVVKRSDEPVRWNDQVLTEVELWLVAFMQNEDGYESLVLEKLPTYAPSDVGIKVRHAGKVKPRESDSVVELVRAGIDRVYCEKSEVVYHWQDGVFYEIAIAD